MLRFYKADGDSFDTHSLTVETAVGVLADPNGVFDVTVAPPSNRGRLVIPRSQVVEITEVGAR